MTEGFWSNFAKPFRVAGGIARGAAAGAAKAVDYALPELTKPLKGAEAAVRDIADTTKTNYDRVAKGLDGFIKEELEEIGYEMADAKLVRHGKNYVVSAHKIKGHDASGNPQLAPTVTTFLVDKNGKILKNLRSTNS